jgi:tubulin polyglutamylase TTLL1
LTFVPETFILPQDYDDFIKSFKENEGALWILKPGDKARGMGITVVDSLSKIPHSLMNKEIEPQAEYVVLLL